MSTSEKKIRISIIVPAYNVEKYITNCINSVKKQTNDSWELIVVDDGSNDETGEICDEFAKDDPRIRVLHQENGGVSKARNVGLSLVDGDYIMFLDADDMLCTNTLEALALLLNKTDYDLISFGLRYVNSGEEGNVRDLCDYTAEEITQNDLIERKLKDRIIPSVASLYKKTIIKSERIILFDEKLYYCEDALFYFQCALRAKKVLFSNAEWYIYIQHDDSSVHSSLPYYKSKTEIDGWKKIRHELIKTDSINIIQMVNVRLDRVEYNHFECDIDFYCRNFDKMSKEERIAVYSFYKRKICFNYLIRNVKNWIKAVLFIINTDVFRKIYLRHVQRKAVNSD